MRNERPASVPVISGIAVPESVNTLAAINGFGKAIIVGVN
jgi:hypothetical protein